MNEENKFGRKNNWTRIFKKKWFFPSLYLMLAALLISEVVWYQNVNTETADSLEDAEEVSRGEAVPVTSEPERTDDAEPVEEEVVKMPVANAADAVIITEFFDYEADATARANALIHYNNRYYQSTGVAIGQADEGSFDVVAAMSGTVSEIKTDPLMGEVVILSHEDDVTTYYASLAEVVVKEGDEVVQGDTLGQAGKNILGKENGVHVHFEMEKAQVKLNPENYFNTPVSSVEVPLETEYKPDEAAETDADEDRQESTPTENEELEEDESEEEKAEDRESTDKEE